MKIFIKETSLFIEFIMYSIGIFISRYSFCHDLIIMKCFIRIITIYDILYHHYQGERLGKCSSTSAWTKLLKGSCGLFAKSETDPESETTTAEFSPTPLSESAGREGVGEVSQQWRHSPYS